MPTHLPKNQSPLKPNPSPFSPNVSQVAAPRISRRIPHQIGPYRVEVNVARKLHGIGIFLYKNRAESPLEEMARTARPGIQIVGVTRIEMMQDRVKITSRSFEQPMIVIGHQAKGVNSGSVTVGRRLQIAQKPFIIFLAPEDVSALIAAGSDVIEGIRILDPQGPRHAIRISKSEELVKSVDLTPIFLRVAYLSDNDNDEIQGSLKARESSNK